MFIWRSADIAFQLQSISKCYWLERVATKYNNKIVFCPKYHCEINPIEGLWCYKKRYVRSRTDQTYSTMLKLIDNFSHHFIKITWI